MSEVETLIEKMFRLSDLYWWSFLPQPDGSYGINDDNYENYSSLYDEVEQLYKSGSFPRFIKRDISFAVAYCNRIKSSLFTASIRVAMGQAVSAEEFSYRHYPFIVNFKTLLNWVKTKSKNQFPEYSIILLNSYLSNPAGVMAPDYFNQRNKLIYGTLGTLGGFILVAGTKDRCIFKLSNQFINTSFDLKVSNSEIKEYKVLIKDGNFVLEESNQFIDLI